MNFKEQLIKDIKDDSDLRTYLKLHNLNLTIDYISSNNESEFLFNLILKRKNSILLDLKHPKPLCDDEILLLIKNIVRNEKINLIL